jgi:hypothetical protein
VVVSRFDPTARTWSPDTSGFLTYPAGEFTTAGATGVRYDTSRRVWLPSGVPTPDGAGYVYADSAGAIHETTIDSGLDRVVVPGSWEPLGFIGNSLYVTEAKPIPPSAFAGGGYTEGGVYKTDLSGSKPVAVTQHSGPWWLSSLGAWTMDRADGFRQAPDRVLHLDLETRAITPWLSGVGSVSVVGFDAAGHPFVVAGGDGVQVMLLIDPETSRNVYSGSREQGWPDAPYYVDGDNVWFSGFGIKDPTYEAPAWLYRPAVGLRPSVGVPGSQVKVAGPCR